MLEKPIRINEIIKLIDNSKVCKVAGPDGVVLEFYKMFKIILAPELEKLLKSCILEKNISFKWNETQIVVIPKLWKDTSRVEAYRPIALLNLVYLGYSQRF